MSEYPSNGFQPVYFEAPLDPQSLVSYEFDWTGRLTSINPTPQISSFVITVPPDLTKGTEFNVNFSVFVQLSGGNLGREYPVECEVTLDSGEVQKVTGIVRVRDR